MTISDLDNYIEKLKANDAVVDDMDERRNKIKTANIELWFETYFPDFKANPTLASEYHSNFVKRLLKGKKHVIVKSPGCLFPTKRTF